MALFPDDRSVPATAAQIEALQVRLDCIALRRPRQWGACWLGDTSGGSCALTPSSHPGSATAAKALIGKKSYLRSPFTG